MSYLRGFEKIGYLFLIGGILLVGAAIVFIGKDVFNGFWSWVVGLLMGISGLGAFIIGARVIRE